ncbi:glycosyltransferase family 2 protein [Butyrivibrio sp. AE2015]|uniref:glycosyltransferase family 2 protein n=1 Tax=Butyrivibrio sp. AE2015 TaxID=1280663 RepID=UPI0003B6E2D1|nr:glycosyltransferase family A protein [Butyrivibrio sp. AE2015]
MNDLISVIIPVYNVELYLDRCMKSILNQTYKNLEIILVDDKSDDRSNELCKDYLVDNRVVIEHGMGEGLSGARNTGLDIAHGKYVVFVDSDDYAELTMIEHLYNCLIDNKADTVIGGFRRKIGKKIEIRENPFKGDVYEEHDEILNKVLKKMLASNGVDHIEMSVWKCLFSMDVIQKNNIRFPDKKYLCEDIIFDFAYFALCNRVVMSGDTGYIYCLNGGSLSQMYQANKFERIRFQTDEMRRLASLIGFDEEAILRIDNFYIGNIIHHLKTMISCASKVGKDKCIKEIERICTDCSVKNVNWNRIVHCFKGKDKIPVCLIKNNRQLLLYCYLRLLTMIRSVIRR